MRIVQLGDRVRVQVSRGTGVVRSAPRGRRRGKTCEFVAGSDQVLRTLSMGVVGMTPGDDRQLTLAAGEAYGAVQQDLIRRIPRTRFPAALRLKVGQRLAAIHPVTRRRRLVRVTEVHPDSVVVNGNHPLAGKVVNLSVRLIELSESHTPK